ncbi:MAG TPA: MFS transporter [Pseudonocardiaceae bacterium]|nr:MFS transporter [Pseudonocardiaceae bacterium]
MLGFFVITLDAVVVNVALPSIRRDLGGDITGLQWVVDGYTLMFAALLLSAGALSDRIGARRAFAAGVVVFVLASAACGLAPSLGALVVARFVQGAAAAVMMPSSMALIGQVYPDPVKRGRAVAVWAMGGLTFGTIEAGAEGFAAPRVVGAFAVAVVALAAFLATEARVPGDRGARCPPDGAPGPVPVPHRVGRQRCRLRVHRRLLRGWVRAC